MKELKMTDIINIKDFYDHETRISIVENAIISIDKRFDWVDKRFEQVDKKFEQVDKRFDELKSDINLRCDRIETKVDWQFKWIMGAFGGLAVSVIGALVTLIF